MEIGGFCLAWCNWYLESRITNPNVHPKKLIVKLNKKLINNNIPIIEYIRSYSSKIDKARVKIMKEFKFKNQELYKMNLPFDRLKLLYDNIYKEMCKILLK